MIDLQRETVVTLPEACRKLPTIDGRKMHVSTLWRWARKGVRGIHLEHIYLGRRLCTSEEALTRFVNALAETDATLGGSSSQDSPVLGTRTPQNHRARAIAEAEASLEQAGI